MDEKKFVEMGREVCREPESESDPKRESNSFFDMSFEEVMGCRVRDIVYACIVIVVISYLYSWFGLYFVEALIYLIGFGIILALIRWFKSL